MAGVLNIENVLFERKHNIHYTGSNSSSTRQMLNIKRFLLEIVCWEKKQFISFNSNNIKKKTKKSAGVIITISLTSGNRVRLLLVLKFNALKI